MKSSAGAVSFLLFITCLMMLPAGLFLTIRHILRLRRFSGNAHEKLILINATASRCVEALTVAAFVQVGLYLFTITRGPYIIDFLDVIY